MRVMDTTSCFISWSLRPRELSKATFTAALSSDSLTSSSTLKRIANSAAMVDTSVVLTPSAKQYVAPTINSEGKQNSIPVTVLFTGQSMAWQIVPTKTFAEQFEFDGALHIGTAVVVVDVDVELNVVELVVLVEELALLRDDVLTNLDVEVDELVVGVVAEVAELTVLVGV